VDTNAFYTISVLLIAWGLTCIALIRCCRQKKKTLSDTKILQSQDIIYHLLSEKQHEAQKSKEILTSLADALNIGLISIKGGIPKPLSNSADPLLKDFGGVAVLNKLKTKLRGGNTLVLKNEDLKKAIQCTLVGDEKKKSDIVVIQDISESFRAAKRLKQQERLAILGKLTAQMAHQIKTPLAILAGQAQMLAKRLKQSPELHVKAISIYEEAQELAKQINSITAFYKTQKPQIVKFDIKELFTELKNTFIKYQTSCSIKFQANQDIKIESDYMMVKSLIYLLIQNALSPETEATLIEVCAEETEKATLIYVKDNGKGVPEKSRKEIFEPFYSTKDEGLGLGLFLASELAQKLGATLSLDESNKGACFTLSFPKQANQALFSSNISSMQ